MQTESRTYRKDHMLALPAAKPGAKAGRAGEGERSRRNREDKRQLSEHHVPTTEASAHRSARRPRPLAPHTGRPSSLPGPGWNIHLGMIPSVAG